MIRAILGDKLLRIFVGLAMIGASVGVAAVIFAVRDCQDRETFLEKCQKACYPNTVYDTKYNRCTCNASVVVKEIP